MRRELLTVLRSGDTLNTAETADEYIQYNSITVLGSSDDAVRFNLNGLDLTLAGGYVGIFAIQSLSVTQVFVTSAAGAGNCGLLVQGFAQKKSIFGN